MSTRVSPCRLAGALLVTAAVVAATTGQNCGGGGGGGGGTGSPTRTFALGFTSFPYANSLEAVLETFGLIRREGDMIVMHFDGGVPWQEALDGTPYPPEFQGELDLSVQQIPPSHVTYLAVTPISVTRDGLALNRGSSPNEPLKPPWDRRSFDHPAVITAFTNHCERMIAHYNPEYFAFSIEANLLFDKAPEQWDAYSTLAEAVYTALRGSHPQLPIFQTIQVESYYGDLGGQPIAVRRLLEFSDMVAVSSYAYGHQPNPRLLSDDYFTNLADLAPDKPFAVAETGWPAEDVSAPYPGFIPADPVTQRAYVEFLLEQADRLSADFVCWFFVRDFDQFWRTDLRFSPLASLARFFRDTGLFDGDGREREGIVPWREWLRRQRR